MAARSRTVSAASCLPESAGSGIPSALQGTGALPSEANPWKSLCRACCCLSLAWGSRFFLRFPACERSLAALLSHSPGRDDAQVAAVLAAGALPAWLAPGKDGRAARGSCRERELPVNWCWAKSDGGGEVLALARRHSWQGSWPTGRGGGGKGRHGPQLGEASLTSRPFLCRAPAVSGNP